MERLAPREEGLLPALTREVRALRGVHVPVEQWGLDRVPMHLRPTYRIVDEQGGLVAEGKDLADLQCSLATPVQAAISSAAGDLEVAGLTTWTVADLPEQISAGAVVGYPALVDEGSSVALRVLPTAAAAATAHPIGVRRLLLLGCASPVKAVSGRLGNTAKLTLARNPHGGLPALMEDCVAAAVDAQSTAVRTREQFEALLPVVRAGLVDALEKVLKQVEAVLRTDGDLLAALAGQSPAASAAAVADVRAQRDRLVHPGFVTEVGAARLPDLVRYLTAARLRLEKLPREADRDRGLQGRVAEISAEVTKVPEGARREQLRWMVEELRVSLFAPTVKAKGPISEQRIWKVLDQL